MLQTIRCGSGTTYYRCSRLPLMLQLRTFACAAKSDAMGQQETSRNAVKLVDRLVGEREQVRRYGDAERLGSREIDNELEFGRLLDRDIAGLCPP